VGTLFCVGSSLKEKHAGIQGIIRDKKLETSSQKRSHKIFYKNSIVSFCGGTVTEVK
jgi:hypothetical protein